MPLPLDRPPAARSRGRRSCGRARRTSASRSPATSPRRWRALREMDLAKLPGVAETIDWANALAFLGADRLTEPLAADTLGAVVKDHEDQELVTSRLSPRSSAPMRPPTMADASRSIRAGSATGRVRPRAARPGPARGHRAHPDVRPRGGGAGPGRPRLALLGRTSVDGGAPRRPRRPTTRRSTSGTARWASPANCAIELTPPAPRQRADVRLGGRSPTGSRSPSGSTAAEWHGLGRG